MAEAKATVAKAKVAKAKAKVAKAKVAKAKVAAAAKKDEMRLKALTVSVRRTESLSKTLKEVTAERDAMATRLASVQGG